METEKKQLHEKPWFAITFVMLLYTAFMLIPNLVTNFMVQNNPNFVTWYASHVYIFWLAGFALLAILWFIIVPLLKLPNGERSLKKFLVSIKLNKIKPTGKTIGLGVVTSVIILGFAVFSCWIETKITGGTQFFISEILIRQDIPLNIYYALDPGIWEEIAFRGVIFALLAKLYSERKTIIINGVMFGLFHLINLSNLISLRENPELMLNRLYSILFQVIYATAMGLFFAYMYSKTKSLVPVIICHYLLDAFLTFLTLVIPSDLIIHLALLTVLGIGLVPAAICIVVVKLVDKRWPEKEEEKERLEEFTL